MADPITYILLTILNLYFWAVVIRGIMSMLMSFGVLNPHQQVVSTVFRALEQIVEPALAPIRRVLPPAGGIDLSPIVLLLAIQFLHYCIVYFSTQVFI